MARSYPISVDEVSDGVFFVCDEDGPVEHSECDAGPWSIRADAQAAKADFLDFLEDEYTEVLISRVLGSIYV